MVSLSVCEIEILGGMLPLSEFFAVGLTEADAMTPPELDSFIWEPITMNDFFSELLSLLRLVEEPPLLAADGEEGLESR